MVGGSGVGTKDAIRVRFDPDRDPELRRLLEKALREATQRGAEDEDLVRAWHFFLLYNEQVGVFGWRKGNRYALSRREWIELHGMIDDKRGRMIPAVPNQSQRNMEAAMLSQERIQMPVRIVCCKVRQNGWSTWELLVFLWAMLTRTNVKARVIADREELCETLLARLKRMFSRLHRVDGTPWKLPTEKSNRDMIVLGEPFNSSVHVVSANTPNPGFGETNLVVAMEETSKWSDAAEKGKGVELALPEVPGSYAFDVSQAKGNTGYFATKFKRSWYRQLGMAEPDSELDGDVLGLSGWRAMFIPWFLHQEYRWTELGSNPKQLPERVRSAIERSLDPEEKILLQQRYLVRGRGWQNVDFDQLAWRRYYIAEKCNGNLQTFHEQCPAFPEEAFLASGRPAFNIDHVQRAVAEHKAPPIFTGRLLASGTLDSDRRGELWIWSHPDPSKQYTMGVDTASGASQGDLEDSGLAKIGSKDPSAIVICEIGSREPVAEWYGWMQPHAFGLEVKRLSDFYHAQVAIETHPSQHGLAVYEAAEQAGCKLLFVQQKWDDREGKFQIRKGWAMSKSSRAMLNMAIDEALAASVAIRSQRLLQELLDAQLDDKESLARTCRNDLITALGLALKLAEVAKVEKRSEAPKAPPPPTGSDEAYWISKRARRGVVGQYDIFTGQGL